MSFLLILSVLWLSLPLLLVTVTQHQLSQQGFSDIEIEPGAIGLQLATIERLQMSNDEFVMKLQGLQAKYQLSDLLSGSVNSLSVDHLTITRKPGDDNEAALPDPVLLSGLLNTRWGEYIPARSVVIKNLSLYDEAGSLSLSASVDLHKQGESISTNIWLVDSRKENHLLSLELSPESGVNVQLHTPDKGGENPISVSLLPDDGVNGLTGQVKVDLSAIAPLATELNDVTGLLLANISYSAQAGSPGRDFTVSAEINEAGFTDWQVGGVTVNLQGNIDKEDNHYRLAFTESSSVEIRSLKQDNTKLAEMLLQLPQSMEIVDGIPQFSTKDAARITLNNVMLDNLSIAEMHLDDIALTGGQQESKNSNCMFSMQMTVPVANKGDIRMETLPLQIDGVCPGGKEMNWSVNAKTERLTIEDNEFRLPLNQCHLHVGNSVDSDSSYQSAVELSGQLSCQSSELSGEVLTRFRFGTDTAAGRASYSISDIKPDSEKALFSSLLKNWTQPFDIVSGMLAIKGEYRWWKTIKGLNRESLIMDLNISEAGGYYENILFSGLDYTDSITLLPTIKSSAFSDLTVRNIDIGMPIISSSAKILLSESSKGPLPLITLNSLRLPLFNGEVQGNDLVIDLNDERHELVLVVVGLDVAEIVAMQQIEGLSATGKLDGYIPVTITQKGINVSDGKIVAQKKGGRIQYTPAQGTAEIEKSAVGSELVFRILKDLNYDSLVIVANYEEDGEMDMKLTIKGISPNVDERRPVHFNLNLQQNVLKLLQGLRYAEGLSADIDRNVQKHFRKRKIPVN
jgi:hypothetical protein